MVERRQTDFERVAGREFVMAGRGGEGGSTGGAKDGAAYLGRKPSNTRRRFSLIKPQPYQNAYVSYRTSY
jgi:hypothetical protein